MSATPSPAELMDLAVEWAREAGDLVREIRDEAIAETETKSSVADVVTAGDKAAEKLITDAIDARRPTMQSWAKKEPTKKEQAVSVG